MNDDDFNILRPNDDEPEQPDDDGPDWLNALDSEEPAAEEANELPAASADDPLSWLNEYAAPEQKPAPQPPAADTGLGWLQDDDDPFADVSGEQGDDDWMKNSSVFSANSDETAESSPTDDIPPWLRDDVPDESAAVPDADLFAGLDEALGIGQAAPQEASQPPADSPAWLQEEAPEAVPDADDLFAQFNEPAAEEVPASPLPEEDDVLGQLKLTDTGSADWFVDEEEQAAPQGTPDWLQDLGNLAEEEAEAPPAEAPAVPADEDIFGELFGDEEPPAAQTVPDFMDADTFDAPGLQDIDSLLASYDNVPVLPQTDQSSMSAADLDRLLSDEEVEEISNRRAGDTHEELPALSPDAPDWLAELGASVGSVDEVSAAAMVRKQTQNERPVDELSDRLYALHEAGLELTTPADTGSAEVIKNLLPGINQVIPAAPIKTGLPGITGEIAIPREQREKINLLKNLVAAEEEKPRAKRPAAIDLTLASPNMEDVAEPDFALEEAALAAEAEPVVLPKRRARVKIDRLLIALLMTVAVVLPFVVAPLRIGDLPPAQFVAGSRQKSVYDRVNTLRSGQLALVAAEYGPTGAAELDSALDALLRHILLRGARPVLVSGNAVGLLHAQNVLEAINQDTAFLTAIRRANRPLVANTDYYVSRYLIGEVLGLRDFAQNLAGLLNSDINGQAMNLHVSSLRDFGLIAVIAERGDDVRAWGEQVAPLAGQPLVIMTGYSAAPLAEPYALADGPGAVAGIGGMLVGYRDAYTYRQMVDAVLFGTTPVSVPATTTSVPAVEATETPVVPLEATGESTVQSGEATSEGAVQAVETAVPTEAATVSGSEAVSTALPTAESATTEPTVQPTSPGVLVQAVIKSDGPVNVREGPSTTFSRVTALQPGTVVQVIGRNGDGSWIQIRFNDGQEGWISAQLIDIQEPTIQPTDEATPTREGAYDVDPNAVAGLLSDVSLRIPAFQQPEATPEVTLEPSLEPAVQSTTAPAAVVSAAIDVSAYRDERWYGMTLGLIVIIVVIAFGALVNIVRGLLRRETK
jgi:Bacterial SH3 domain